MEGKPLDAQLLQAITARIIDFLKATPLGDKPEFQEALTQFLPAMLDLAAAEGQQAVLDVLADLEGDNSRAATRRLVAAASPANRIKLLQAGGEEVIAATIEKIKREKAQWTLFVQSITFAASLLPLLL